MKILFVSTSIPPATDMQTTRNLYLISGLLEKGHSVDILSCGEYIPSSGLFDAILNRTKTHRTKVPLILRWHKFVTTRCKVGILLKIHNVLINYYAIPDIYAGWGKVAIHYVKKKQLFDYDAIITSSGSYTSHEVGKAWKEITKKKWIAEYGDPWGLDKFGNINKVYYKLEKKLMSLCDGFVFTTQATIDAYKKHYDSSVPYALVPCGYGDIINDYEKSPHSDGLVFTYTGVAYKRDRNLSGFINAVKGSSRIKAMLVGTISEDVKSVCNGFKNITIPGRVPYERSLEIIGSSDVLVHIGNYGTMQVPGKTYIYLSSKKPILYIQQQPSDDPTLQVLLQFKGVIACKNDDEEIEKAINYIIDNYAKLKMEAEERVNSETLLNYCWKNLGKQFATFVEQCTK